MSEQQAEEIIEALEEPLEKPKKATRKKAPAADIGLNPATIRARAIVLGRLKS